MINHICIHKDCIVFGNELIPFGKEVIEKDFTYVLPDILDHIVPLIEDGQIIICGEGDSRRMLGRKLEDRLKREVIYE